MLTKKELRRLAKEARVLAMECVEGTAPPLLQWPRCAAGIAACRAGVLSVLPAGWPSRAWCEIAETTPDGEARCVAFANDDSPLAEERPFRVVFPLLALADALEDASKESLK